MERYLPPLSETGVRWLRFGALVAVVVLLGWSIISLRPVLTPIFVALVIAYILNPLVSWLERRRISRLRAITLLYIVGTALLLAAGAFLTGKTIAQIVQWRDNVDRYVESAKSWLAARPGLTGGLEPAPAATQPDTQPTAQPDTRPAVASIDWWAEIGPLLRKHGVGLANSLLAFLTGFLLSALNWITIFVLIPMFTFFFLWKFNDIVATVRAYLPARYRDTIVYLVTTTDAAVANFFRGRLIVCLIVGLATGIGWTLVGVPYSLPLGALAGALNLVPFMSLLALPPALLVTYLDATGPDTDWKLPVVLTMAVYMAVQALESFVLTPTIESKSSGLHPITTVVALLIGAQWAGLLGMLLAIPITSTLKTLATELVLPEVRRLAGQPPPSAAKSTGDQTGKSQP